MSALKQGQNACMAEGRSGCQPLHIRSLKFHIYCPRNCPGNVLFAGDLTAVLFYWVMLWVLLLFGMFGGKSNI